MPRQANPDLRLKGGTSDYYKSQSENATKRNKQVYDSILYRVPKGMKEVLLDFAGNSKGKYNSLNDLITKAVGNETGIKFPEIEKKKKA